MGFLTLPVLLLLTVTPAPDRVRDLGDFTRFRKTVGEHVALVQQDGTVRQGVVTDATIDQVTMRFGTGTTTFARTEVASADRLRDGRKDGVVKGALFGVFFGLLMNHAYSENGGDFRAGHWAQAIGTYAGIGYLLDAAQTHREPIYRASPAVAPKVKLSLRF